jgi:very-short-patch-repair endonuclease
MAKDPVLVERAKHMRRNPTPFERKLWLALRAKRFQGAKFRQQQVIGSYIVDFACRTPRMLVVEVDGDSHGNQLAYDERRQEQLKALGYRVLRFTNSDVGGNLDGVLTVIAEAIDTPSLPPLAAAPSLP